MECDCGETLKQDVFVLGTKNIPVSSADQMSFYCEKCGRDHWIQQEVITSGGDEEN